MTMEPEEDKKKGLFQQVNPRWIAENLGVAALGFGLGHYGGGALAGLVAGHPKVQALSPKTKQGIVQGARFLGGTAGVGTGMALNQLRRAMTERLIRKRREKERRELEAPSPEKVASVLIARGWNE